MDRFHALDIVNQYVKNPNLVNHMLCVEAAMRWYARYYSQDEDLWAVVGLLHDFDWEIHPTIPEHPVEGAPILKSLGVSDEVIQAVLSHADFTGVPRQSLMEKALFACDEVTGLITAVALVRPSHSLYDLTSSSVKKKWKDRAFAAGANREEIAQGAQEIGIDLWQHIDNVIQAMRTIAPQIGLEGSLPPTYFGE